MRFATVAQVAALADAIPRRYRALVLVAAYTGLRWGELAGLRVKRVDLLHRRFLHRCATDIRRRTRLWNRKEAAQTRCTDSREEAPSTPDPKRDPSVGLALKPQ